MTNTANSPSSRTRPLAGTGRLGVVSAYFTLYGIASAAVTAGIGAAILVPGLGWHTTPANPFVALGGGLLLTFGFLRTNFLLRRRRKAGAQLAVLCLASSLAISYQAGERGWLAIGIPVLGVALLVSVWRHLE